MRQETAKHVILGGTAFTGAIIFAEIVYKGFSNVSVYEIVVFVLFLIAYVGVRGKRK